MRSDKYLWEVSLEIYRQMYKEAEPSADFDELMKSGETKKRQWFMKYYLDKERQEEIFESICKKHRITEKEREKLSFEIWLGVAPSFIKKTNPP